MAARRSTAAWRSIARSLRQDGPQTVRSLSNNLQILPRHVRVLLQWMITHKYVARVPNSRKHELTKEGAEFGKLNPRRKPAPRPKKKTSWVHVLNVEDD